MASTNKTPNLELSQWDLSDKPEMADFNNAFENIEDFKDEFDSHKAEKVSQAGGVHGLKIENGTWTPTIIGETTQPTVTNIIQRGTYVRIGNVIKCSFFIRTTLSGGSGNLSVGGLPFIFKQNDEAGVVGNAALSTAPLNYTSFKNGGVGLNRMRVSKDTKMLAQISEVNNGQQSDLGGSITYEIN